MRKLRSDGNTDTGGWEGIKNEIQKSYAGLMDGQIRAALSPPYDFDFEWLTREDYPPSMVNIMEDLEYADVSAPITRALLTSALIWKRKALRSRPQFWLLDEISALGAWDLAPKLATISAGYGIRTAYVCQSARQLDALAKDAGEIIANSCGTSIYLGIRSPDQAARVSRQLGRVTLEFDDIEKQQAARTAKSKAITEAVLNGGDPVTAMLSASHQDFVAQHKSKMARDLRSVDELINEPNDRAFVFMPGVLERPFYAHVPRYWHRRDLAGMYMRDPFVPGDPNTVEIATRWGQRSRQIITEDAPQSLLDWPQHQSGQWSYVKGFKP